MDSQRTQDTGIAGRVRESATAQLATQKDRATDGLGSVVKAVRDTTEHLRGQQHETVARYAEQAADQIERFSQKLRDKDVGQLLKDAQELARRQPALFIGGAFAVGLLGARFLKSSAPNDWRNQDRAGFTPQRSSNPQFPNAYGNTVPTPASTPSSRSTERF